MHLCLSEVWLSRRVGPDLLPYSFELSAADVLQILPFWRCGCRLVKIDGNLKALPDLRPYMPRHSHTVLYRHTLNGNEGHHISSAHAGMRTLMFGQVNKLRCLPNSANGRFLN